MAREVIQTDQAPAAIGPYSQAVKIGTTVYLSGQIGLQPQTMELAAGIDAQTRQIFANLQAVATAAGGDLNKFAKVTIFLTDLSNFSLVNDIMAEHFQQPYPARAAIGVAELPKAAEVEIEAIMELS